MNDLCDIGKANFRDFKEIPFITVVGKRRSGKTVASIFVLSELIERYTRVSVMVGNKHNRMEWSPHVPPLFVVEKSIKYVTGIRNFQEALCDGMDTDKIPRSKQLCLIIDDCGSDIKFMKHPIMRDLSSNARHYGITLIFICQYFNQLEVSVRHQIDYLLLAGVPNQTTIDKLHAEFGGSNTDARIFRHALSVACSQHSICVLDNTGDGLRLQDVMSYKKIPWPLPFKELGTKQMWEFSQKHCLQPVRYTPTGPRDSEEDEEDPGSETAGPDRVVFTDRRGTVVIRRV